MGGAMIALFLRAGLAHGLAAHGLAAQGADLPAPAQDQPAQVGILEKRAHYKVGDHVYAELTDETGTNWVKASISGPGRRPGSYNVHLWVGPSKRREMPNISVELLRDASQLEQVEQLQKQAEEEARRKAVEYQQALQRRREADEAAARERARDEAERRALEQRKAAARAERELKAAKAAAEEAERQELERVKEREKIRKQELKAKWEAVKAARQRASELEEAFDLLSSDAAREAKALLQHQADMRSQAASGVQDDGDRTIHLAMVHDPDGREASIGLERTTPLRVPCLD